MNATYEKNKKSHTKKVGSKKSKLYDENGHLITRKKKKKKSKRTKSVKKTTSEPMPEAKDNTTSFPEIDTPHTVPVDDSPFSSVPISTVTIGNFGSSQLGGGSSMFPTI
mmetsp:Transcript_11115/g.16364  ORF Transcript_11115/g.16364 Transcript_11115/m.16364 type:complete len:109 (+) Transcript_11115:1938-2264(+)